ncbi:hypothetical protein ACJ73_01082 [Blastomyces percursus]|uniref:Uncharacterized protein n=1 Tax=Blastomyces percursus TaxID=1658174 RepID=A0A1J9QG96_9EURO|nr:hypothetical protein ACJ73_01082 [Blastomyces percursus]
MYWSALGMMNNPWFRVTITKTDGYLKFEHPTQPGLIPGGWMERVKKNGGDLANGNWGAVLEGSENTAAMEAPKINLKKPGLDITISLERFKSHKTGPQSWFALEGEEGHRAFLSAAGLDVTEEFMAIRETPTLTKHNYFPAD